jgi:hypothetical protein
MLQGIDVLKKGFLFEDGEKIFTLDKRYAFSLNTNLGLTAKSIDPELINNHISKESMPGSRLDDGKLFFEDRGIVFSLEIKF